MNLKRTAWVAFLLLIAFYLGLFWFNQYVPTRDGPGHLDNALLLRDLCLPGGTRVEQYYRLNWSSGSNLLGHAAVAAFAAGMPPFAA